MTPEAKAREEIDRQLAACGWIVQPYREMNISAGPGVAVREFPLKTGSADYLLYADGKVVAAIEAKPEGHTLTGVETQSAKYTSGLPDFVPCHRRPIPFGYESTGTETQFTNGLDPDSRSREVFTLHRPDELLRLVALDGQVRAKLRRLPELNTERLWRIQIEAIRNLEASLAYNRPRALIQMATGSGKTYTACSFCCRLITFAGAKRILFLVDRNTLGRQTLTEFQNYASPYSGYRFSDEFVVQRLTRNTIDPASKVCITTIQRLYAMLKGEEEYPEENEEGSLFETETPLIKEPMPVAYNPAIPIETFDFIVVDECHRSIYNIWRQVLEYFDAFIIGLTATPTPQTVGFFDGNVVQDYSHEKAVADNVNVGYQVYRIKTRVSQDGATLEAEAGAYVPVRDRRTRAVRLIELDDDLTYTANQLDRDFMNPTQMRLIIQTFRDRLFTEIFPGRREVPKTLVYAKSDMHADDLVKIFREEFGKGNDFCQKITYKTTGKKPEDLLNEFRNSYNPRIAVTVDMIATGTDVKPLECVFFMRNVNSASYFEQMKGRGTRVIQPDDLQSVTPDAPHKTHFVIVDAVGVCEREKTPTSVVDRQPSVSFEKLLQLAAQGVVHADLVSTLAARLARLGQEVEAEQQTQIAEASGGITLAKLTSDLIASFDPDANDRKAREWFNVPAGVEPTDAQLDAVERERMSEALKPFHNPKLRGVLTAIRARLDQVIDEKSGDELIAAGFNEAAKAKARSLLDDFRRFIEDNRDEIEALRLLYRAPHRAGLRFRHVKELAEALKGPPLSLRRPEDQLWRLYEAVEPENVRGKGGKSLVDLVAIVRHAINPAEPLVSVADAVEERYKKWLGDKTAEGVAFSPDQRRWLDAIKDRIAASLAIERQDFDEPPFSQLGGLGRVYGLFGDRLDAILNEMNERVAA